MKVLVSFIVGCFVSVAFAQAESPSTNHRLSGNQSKFVMVAAHRGGYANDKQNQAPENSVANVAVAIKQGYDVFETDIQRTADGVFVIIHDETIDRETNGTGMAKDMKWNELKKLKKRYRDGSLSDQSVATLEDLLVAGKGKILFKPDLKPGIIEHFDELARLISRLEMADQVFLRTGFKDAPTIKQCFDNGTPRVEVMFKVKSEAQVRAIIRDFQPKTIQVNLAAGDIVSRTEKAAIREAVANAVLVETHSDGEPSQWLELAQLGVRMFHTSKPDLMLKFLNQNGWRDRGVE
ncbi:glycerophosphodiester phosphodiesterase family protein [Rubripirellula amarantea]|uniref:Putative glycerophosphoryl diester phosphodiesterase 1 n=1 Tax=Rubripirellula amarantea TaxID=2527999 RepID=A0A5C5WHD1_9BACT|nr:glycerophosphodiester phosphodiesterase family protein [Rubripirellula amarantea]MDA8746086.1 glycerophosphodiester phosphodiesterase family protein [Rubripirellula amarantea]TWT50198.1 putative glycerophosphoryl diester phosphodiesterase 1 [Rubripirellula amarantea]